MLDEFLLMRLPPCVRIVFTLFEIITSNKERTNYANPILKRKKHQLFSAYTGYRMLMPNKNNLIENGTFAKGMDHWFFTADNHIPWRAENLWVQILFDQGWLGLIIFNLILFYVMINLLRHILKHDYYAAITLASLTGFLVLSIIDSMLDQPAILLLFFMVIYISLINLNSNKNIPPFKHRRQHNKIPLPKKSKHNANL